MIPLAALAAHRRRLVAASRARRPARAKQLPAAAPPSAVVATYTRALLDVTAQVHAVALEVLRAEGLLPAAARVDAADGTPPRPPQLEQLPLPGIPSSQVARVTSRMRARIREVVNERRILSTIDHVAELAQQHSRAQWQQQLRAAMGVDVTVGDPDLGLQVRAFRRTNTDLINSLVDEHVDRVRRVLSDAGHGTRVEEIAEQIQVATGATESRAALIARDQVLSLNAEVTEARHAAAGITEYIWRTSRDERVRKEHKLLDGTRHRYDDPPVVDARRGERANPGTYYQCRCTAEPIIPGFDG